jgi:hypothetical protein
VSDVDDLRAQLRDRGYLSHGIERWFALDPWSSRAFWVELVTVCAKAAILIALFAALPMTAIMLLRNRPLATIETIELYGIYAAAWFVVTFLLMIISALLLKLRPSLPIDTPRALLGISIVVSSLLVAPFAMWWYRFDTDADLVELGVGIALAGIFFIVATIVASAALLSFSIYEVQRVPVIHQKPRTIPLAVSAAVLIVILFGTAYATPDRADQPPMQVVTTPTDRRVALIAVDGLTFEIAQSRPDLTKYFASTSAVEPMTGRSTTERWASIGTGVPAQFHGVRSVDGVRLAGGSHVFQNVSRADVVLPNVGQHVPLPPTVRKRDYMWEVFAGRGIASLAVNWWTTESAQTTTLTSIGQEEIFRRDPLAVDEEARRCFFTELDQRKPQFATIYLPALDVVLNRIRSAQSLQLAHSLRVLDGVARTVDDVRKRGYDVVLVGVGVIGSTLAIDKPTSAYDVAPTLSTLLGFPASEEMPGTSLIQPVAPRIASYGPRVSGGTGSRLNQEYYESLKSLGYIR